MAASQMTTTSFTGRSLLFPSTVEGTFKPSSVSHFGQFGGGLSLRSFRGLSVKAATVVAPKVFSILVISSFLIYSNCFVLFWRFRC